MSAKIIRTTVQKGLRPANAPLKSFIFSTHWAVCGIKMSGYDIEFAVCRLHSENAKWITARWCTVHKEIKHEAKNKMSSLSLLSASWLTQVATALALSDVQPKFLTRRVSLQTQPLSQQNFEHRFRYWATLFCQCLFFCSQIRGLPPTWWMEVNAGRSFLLDINYST